MQSKSVAMTGNGLEIEGETVLRRRPYSPFGRELIIGGVNLEELLVERFGAKHNVPLGRCRLVFTQIEEPTK